MHCFGTVNYNNGPLECQLLARRSKSTAIQTHSSSLLVDFLSQQHSVNDGEPLVKKAKKERHLEPRFFDVSPYHLPRAAKRSKKPKVARRNGSESLILIGYRVL